MNVFQRSWHITKLTFSIIKEDKVLLIFPILSAFFSLLLVVAFVFPMILFPGVTQGLDAITLLYLFIFYLALTFITVFFDFCVVYTAKQNFRGEDASFSQTIAYATSKFWIIFSWSLVSAIVGVLLRILESLARNSKGAGKLVGTIIYSMIGMAWSIITIFVVPTLVYENKTPFAAIKQSAITIKRTWGESLIRYFGLGLAQAIFMIVGGAIFFMLALFSLQISEIIGAIMFGVMILYLVIVFLVFHVANDVFNTALYEYAQTGSIPSGFDETSIKNAFSKDTKQR